jgi:hypothetical protein
MIKKIGFYAGVFAIMAALSAPSVMAQGQPGGNNEAGRAAGKANVCSGFEAQIGNLVGNVSNRVGKIESDRSEKEVRRANQWKEFETNRNELRVREDANLSARFSKLDEVGKTDAEKQAISAFQAAIENALKAKRAAMDAAIKAFQDGTETLLSSRKTAVSNSFSGMQAAFQAAADKAEADCTAGVTRQTVRTDFMAALKNARKNFDSAQKSVNDFSVSMKSLVDAKQAAFKKAQDDFKAAVTQARDALKAVLGENTNATSTNP